MTSGSAGRPVEIDIELQSPAWLSVLPSVESLARTAAQAALSQSPPRGDASACRELCLVFADDALVRRLNRQFRGQDRPTNVLSFASGDDGPPESRISLGDVVLALETCQREAEEQGKPLPAHVSHLVVHGVLHLLGHEHDEETEAEVMEGLERRVLAHLGLPDPYGIELTESDG